MHVGRSPGIAGPGSAHGMPQPATTYLLQRHPSAPQRPRDPVDPLSAMRKCRRMPGSANPRKCGPGPPGILCRRPMAVRLLDGYTAVRLKPVSGGKRAVAVQPDSQHQVTRDEMRNRQFKRRAPAELSKGPETAPAGIDGAQLRSTHNMREARHNTAHKTRLRTTKGATGTSARRLGPGSTSLRYTALHCTSLQSITCPGVREATLTPQVLRDVP